MPRRGIVEISTAHLAARCTKCRKHIEYAQMEPPMTADWWKAIFIAFIKKHNNDCRPKEVSP